MTEWYNGITQQEFTDAVNDAVVRALGDGVNDRTADYKDLVRAHLKLWAESGIPAPVNEGNSIQAWLRFLGCHTKEETLDAMRQRMILLMQAANEVHKEGPDVENALGIYDNRPDLRP